MFNTKFIVFNAKVKFIIFNTNLWRLCLSQLLQRLGGVERAVAFVARKLPRLL